MKNMQDCYVLKNGVKIPCIGLGTWQTPDGDVAASAIRAAVECGYRHIDTATDYGNEESIGRGIRECGLDRKELFITTKLWNTDHGYESTLKAFDLSMKKLGLDYLDLYLIHWPNPVMFRDCWQQKNAESWKAMEKLYEEGRIRAIGISNFQPRHIEPLLQTANIMPMVNQMRLNVAERQEEMVAYCRKLGMQLEAYSPMRTGKVLAQSALLEVAEKHQKSPAQICIRWVLQMGYLPLPKSVTPERIKQNADIFGFELDADDLAKLATLEGCVGLIKDPDKVDY